MQLKDARILVTGGSSGIGATTAKALTEAGARVAICARRKERLDEVAAETGATPIVADISRSEEASRAVDEAAEALGGLNVLVNNAGFGTFAPLAETDLDSMRQVFDVNVFGAMLMARESLRYLIPGGGGSIINIASTAASRGFAGGTAYAASKFALAGMTESWRAELRKHDIRVMQINPSEVLTEFASVAGFDQAASDRKLKPVDVAHLILSLLRLENRAFVTDVSLWATNPP